MRHLDNIYKNRYILFYTPVDVLDSRVINWRDVKWSNVVKLSVRIGKAKHDVGISEKPNFKFFMNFRCAGENHVLDKETNRLKKIFIHEWVVGWSDGVNCFLNYIDFKTGALIKKTIEPLNKLKNHIHPDVQSKAN